MATEGRDPVADHSPGVSARASRGPQRQALDQAPSQRKGVIPVKPAWWQGPKSLSYSITLLAENGDIHAFS